MTEPRDITRHTYAINPDGSPRHDSACEGCEFDRQVTEPCECQHENSYGSDGYLGVRCLGCDRGLHDIIADLRAELAARAIIIRSDGLEMGRMSIELDALQRELHNGPNVEQFDEMQAGRERAEALIHKLHNADRVGLRITYSCPICVAALDAGGDADDNAHLGAMLEAQASKRWQGPLPKRAGGEGNWCSCAESEIVHVHNGDVSGRCRACRCVGVDHAALVAAAREVERAWAAYDDVALKHAIRDLAALVGDTPSVVS